MDIDMNEATAKAIAAERAAAGLTTKRLAEESGIPERTLIRILKAERDIKVTQLAQLADVFNLYPHELIEEAERFQRRAQRTPSVPVTDEKQALATGERSPALDDGPDAALIAAEEAALANGTADKFGLTAKKGATEAEQLGYTEDA